MKHDYVVFPGFELIGHITKTLYADEMTCGLRCLQDGECQSYNSKSDANDAKKECQLSNQTKKLSPENLSDVFLTSTKRFSENLKFVFLLIRPSPVRKFWTLGTPKETGSIGSTPRRVETL